MTAWIKLAWDVVKNPKNTLIAGLVGLVCLLAFGTYHYHGKVLSLELKYSQQANAEKQARLDLAKKNKEQINILNAKYQQSRKALIGYEETIKNLKLKSERCQDEEFYNTARSIIDDYNNSL